MTVHQSETQGCFRIMSLPEELRPWSFSTLPCDSRGVTVVVTNLYLTCAHHGSKVCLRWSSVCNLTQELLLFN